MATNTCFTRAARCAFAPSLRLSARPAIATPTRIQQRQWRGRMFAVSAALKTKRYTEDHEWVDMSSDGKTCTLGITTYAAKALGDVIYVELPEIGVEIGSGDAIGAVESVKSASDILTPVSGKVVDVNSVLEEKPKLLNDSPEADGWVAKIEVEGGAEKELQGKTMDKAAYEKFIEDL